MWRKDNRVMTTDPAERPARHSAFPPDVTDLMPAARTLSAELHTAGKDLSRNALMSALHIGAPKARAVLDQLRQETTPEGGISAGRPLHLVPTTPEPDEVAAELDSDGDDQADHAGPTDDEHDQAVTDDQAAAPEPAPADQAPAEPEATAADRPPAEGKSRRVPVWPVLLLTLPALAAIWSGWVGLGGMAGFGIVHPLPGIADHVTFNTAITLPIGVEVYAAYALYAWLSGAVPERARKFARTSAVVSLCVGAAGQVTYHLLAAAHVQHAPWLVVTLVACLPVAVLGMGAALAHLVRDQHS
jgi:hypothetical protein